MCARLQQEGSDPIQELKRLAVKYGLVETLQWSKRLEGESGQARIEQILTDLRAQPLATLGDESVTTFTDLKNGQSWVNGQAVSARTAGINAHFSNRGPHATYRSSQWDRTED